MVNANDIQIGGTHYQTDMQHWDWVLLMGYGYEYFTSAATKYIARHEKKNGVTDLLKAKHYVEKLLEAVNEGYVTLPGKTVWPGMQAARDAITAQFCRANKLNLIEASLIHVLSRPTSTGELLECIQSIARLAELRYERSTAGPLTLSSAGFIGEGFTGNQAHWQCRRCSAHITIPEWDDPDKAHQCANRSYVDQGRDI
jgi:Protein of unknwon function (DUF3310)